MSSYFEPPPSQNITVAQATNINTAANDVRSGTTSVPIIRPGGVGTGTPPLITAGVGVFVYGAWTQYVAANNLAAHMLIWWHSYGDNSSSDNFQFQIGVGGAGAEVGIGEWMLRVVGAGPYWPFPVIPAIQIPANARVAIRCASIAGGNSLYMELGFLPRPIA